MFGKPKSERQAAERNLKRGGIPEHTATLPSDQGRITNYVADGRRGVAYVIPPGGKSIPQELDERMDQALREGLA